MQGNPKVIEYLNRALRHELTAVNQYWLHYRLLDNWGYKTLAKRWRKESIEEMQHADKIIEHIIFLDNPKFVGRHGTLQRKATLSVPQKNAARRRICKMVKGWRSKNPRAKRSGALRDAPASIYVLGGFPPRGASLCVLDAICIMGPNA
jgi:rubrerythrin